MYVVAIAIGLFYIFAGVVALRAMRVDALMDGVLTALEGKPQASVEKWKSAILTVGGWLTLASGLALATLSPLAPPLFIANTIVQAAYPLWATRYLPPADTGENVSPHELELLDELAGRIERGMTRGRQRITATIHPRAGS